MIGKGVFNAACLLMLLMAIAFMTALSNEETPPHVARVSLRPPVRLPGSHTAKRRGRPAHSTAAAARAATKGQHDDVDFPPGAVAKDADRQRAAVEMQRKGRKRRRSLPSEPAEMPVQNPDPPAVINPSTESIDTSEQLLNR